MTTIVFKPLGNYVLIEPAKAKEQTKSGILLPTAAQEHPNQGAIVAMGDGSQNEHGDLIPMRVRMGDVVMFPKYAGTEVNLGDTKYVLIREVDLLGVVTEK